MAANTWIAPTAVVIGDVEIGEYSSIWWNTILRGDSDKIVIGKHTNIQDNCIVHMNANDPVYIGNYVSIAHSAIVHACTIHDGVLIGMGARVLDRAEIGEGSLIGAGALVPPRMKVPPRSLVVGFPGKIVRELSEEEVKKHQQTWLIYENRWKTHYSQMRVIER
ncbi:MAG: gamma carbonic anhydrase family protein [Firmicutes bacterium]|nr:gamma carbonic anhydrase family protein [Bacillota bacterium]